MGFSYDNWASIAGSSRGSIFLNGNNPGTEVTPRPRVAIGLQSTLAKYWAPGDVLMAKSYRPNAC
jgi:hypothetical protein